MKKTNKSVLACFLVGLSLSSFVGCSDNKEKEHYADSIVNGGFESSVNDGIPNWKAKGLGAFSYENITRASKVNDVDVLKEGDYFFSGIESSLPSYTGSLESDYFVLGGLGEIAFKMGAAKDVSKIYIQFFKKDSDTPLQFKANGGEVLVDKIGNDDFNATTITDQMIQKYVDLSDYLDEVIKIVIVDNDTNSDISDYSYVNIDDFKIINNASERNEVIDKRTRELELFKEEEFEEDETSTTLRNGGFELGDFTGWKVLSGNALTIDHIDNSTSTFWGERLYHAEGNYFLNGFKTGNEDDIGKIRSEKFTVVDSDENVYASFRIGGALHSTQYVSVVDASNNSEIVRINNKEFNDPLMSLNMHEVFVDLSAHKGKVLYFTVNDTYESSGGFRAIIVDDFKINLSENDVLNEIENLRNASYEEDNVAGEFYKSLYNGGYSFPIKGNAPIIDSNTEYAYETAILPTNNFNLYQLLNNVSVFDDYTATKDLVRRFVSVSYEEEKIENPNFDSFDFSEDGNYYLTFTISDAYEQSTTGTIKVAVNSGITYSSTIENGGFESGDLTGWTVVDGEVDVNNAISSDSIFWGEKIPFNKSGTYFFNGWNATSNELNSYTLRSTFFQLSGSGYISFKLGGRSAALRVYTSSGSLIADYRNELFRDDGTIFPSVSKGSRLATMNGYVADLSEYIGQALYIEISDLSLDNVNWQVAFFDDIQTYYENVPDISNMKDVVQEYLIADDYFMDVDLYYSEAHNVL